MVDNNMKDRQETADNSSSDAENSAAYTPPVENDSHVDANSDAEEAAKKGASAAPEAMDVAAEPDANTDEAVESVDLADIAEALEKPSSIEIPDGPSVDTITVRDAGAVKLSAWETAVAVAAAASASKEAEAANAAENAPVAEQADASADDSEDELEDEKKPRKRGLRWSKLTYVTRTSIAFALVAGFTAIVAIGVVSIVWGDYFRAYTSENMESLASTTANRISALYAETGELVGDSVKSVVQAAVVSPDVGIKVLDSDGNTVYETMGSSAPNSNGSTFEPSEPAQIALANIVVGNSVVGSVRLWVYGSDTLMNRLDQQFLDNSYLALAVAAVAAVIAASILGSIFARRLVLPINRLTRTAVAVKAGKFDARSNLKGEDEIAHLGETFDSMIESVERNRKLEQRLTSDMAHELRTPLMGIQTNIEAMIDGVYETDAEHLEMVNGEVQRLSRLVNALLKLSRLENRSTPMNVTIIDLGELVGDIVQTHELFVSDSGLTIGFYADRRVLVRGDADMLRQATINLISNAVRYTPEGGSIDVSVRRGTAMASIAVKDTGVGLSPEEIKMVFNRFWRADSGRARESGGLGIGLAVVKEIVDRHKGWVGVEGEKGKGATFTIHIPLYEDTISRVRARTASNTRNKKNERLSGGRNESDYN